MKIFAKRLGLITLAAVLLVTGAWGQTTINFDNADNWTTGSASITSYATDHTYVDGLFFATGGPALRNTTSTQDGYPGALGTYAWRLNNVSTVDWRITISSGGVGTFGIDIRRWDGTPSPAYNLEYSINGGTNWTLVSAINNTTLDNSSNWKTFNGTINSANTNILIRLVATGTTERIHVDNFVWTGYVPDDPTVTISADPALSESNLNGAEVDIALANETFADESLSSGNFTLNNAPSGVTVYSVAYGTTTTATLTLAFDGTDFDADVSDFNITVAGAELTGGSPLTSNNLTISYVAEEPANHVADFTGSAITNWSATLTWTDNNDASDPADGFLLEGYPSGSGGSSFTPSDGDASPSNENSVFAWVEAGVGTYTFNGLSPETQYTARIWPYSGSGSSIDYKTDGTIPSITASTAATPSEGVLFFSEYIEGSSNNKAVEIFNPTASSIDLSSYSILLFSNGSSSPTGSLSPMSGTLVSGDVYVVANSSANATILAAADITSGIANYNGDDALGLFYGNYLIDVIGRVGVDPGTAWDVAGTSNATAEYTLIRKTSIQNGNIDWETSAGTSAEDSEWAVFAQDYTDNLGQHTVDYPLPITLASFSAKAVNGKVNVIWVTESETENAAYRIYRDGEMIAELEGAGTTSEPQSYSWTDQYVVPGKTYSYQLADVSFDGEETKHARVEVEVEVELSGKDYHIGAAYPNPFNPVTLIPLNLAKDAVVRATLYDLTGRPLRELQNGSLSAGSHALKIDGTNLSTGIYFVHVRVNDATHVQKIALMK